MSSSMDTIEIVGGVHAGTKRLQLKSVLERYGEIDICHKVGDPIQHIPWVRFVNASGARQAMDAIERQEVLIDGVAIKARWKPRGKDNLADERKGYTSRDIFLAEKERKGGGGGGGGSRVMAPCSSIRLRLAEGPRQMRVPGCEDGVVIGEAEEHLGIPSRVHCEDPFGRLDT
eukprot:Skav223445  [mRNA]  locus=scaffold350:775840:778514:- [translate_table: standard]